VIRPLNKNSNNFYAEMVLKTLGAEYKGAPGSTQAGIEAVGSYLESIGIAKGSYRMSNGSGLWGETRFSTAQLVKILDAAYRDFKIAPDYVASLAIAGTDGTLRSRMKKGAARGYLKAKTGTLEGASSLSGYVKRRGDDVIAFSILFNEIEGGAGGAKTAQSKIGAAIAAYLQVLANEAPSLDAGDDPDGDDSE
jgi:D-alanyl-D-alanine carboxypeptidase/D-alanyl-D-alanine-endopeptidase (penicillin-binding protein 4)